MSDVTNNTIIDHPKEKLRIYEKENLIYIMKWIQIYIIIVYTKKDEQ